MSNIYLTGVALVISLLLITMLFIKKGISNIETKTFKRMLIINMLESLTTTLIVVVALTINSEIVFKLLNRIDVILIITWCSLMYYYIHSISSKSDKMFNIIMLFNMLAYILAIFLNVNIINENGILNSTGPLTYLGLVGALVYITLMLVEMIILRINKNNIDRKKYLPLYFLILLLILIAVLRMSIPEINFISIMISLVDMIMAFTIENPDIKMLDELAKNKKIIDNQNEDTTNFLFRITQDIKKPIQDLLELSKEGYVDPKYLNNKMRELDFTVNDVLDVSGMSTRRIKLYDNNYDIHNLMKEIKIKTESELPKEIKMEYNISRNVPKMLYGDYIMLKKVVLSMIDNAIKHTKEGYISLDVDAIVKYDVARVIISVSDTGVGMDLGMINDILSHEISDEQYQLDNEKGILNLRDIKHIMPSLDGTFVIKSEKNLGTTVSITVNERIVNTEEREIAKKIEMYEESLNSGKKIMVVDDDAIELSKIKKIIENKGNSCNTSLFGKDVVEKVSKGHKYDLIILDDETDTHSAYEIYGQLKKIKGFDIPVIIMIEDDKEFIKLHFLKEGFSDVIMKSKLNDEVLRVLDRKY